MSYTAVKDSGQREEMDTGSVRDTREGKGRFDLISPIFLDRFAKHLENGASKYGDRNWEKGQPVSRFYDSAARHMNKFLEGHRDEDHLAAAAWNIQGIIHTEEMVRRGKLPSKILDMPMYLADEDQTGAAGVPLVDVPEWLPQDIEGYEFTGEFRDPGYDDIWLDGVGNDSSHKELALESVVSFGSSFLERNETLGMDRWILRKTSQ